MGLIFRMNKAEIGDFWSNLEKVKANHKDSFFIYLDKERPEFDEGGIIEIVDF
jgi:hypothetical protein